MTDEQGFRIEVSSKYEEWWRYNAALMCGCFDAADDRTDFAASEDHLAEVGTNLPQKPADIPADHRATLLTPACDHILLYIYIVPHTLPASNDIAVTQPFDIDVNISYNGRKILSEHRSINQWSGASIELRIGQKGLQ